jgi:hypothetical protein
MISAADQRYQPRLGSRTMNFKQARAAIFFRGRSFQNFNARAKSAGIFLSIAAPKESQTRPRDRQMN